MRPGLQVSVRLDLKLSVRRGKRAETGDVMELVTSGRSMHGLDHRLTLVSQFVARDMLARDLRDFDSWGSLFHPTYYDQRLAEQYRQTHGRDVSALFNLLFLRSFVHRELVKLPLLFNVSLVLFKDEPSRGLNPSNICDGCLRHLDEIFATGRRGFALHLYPHQHNFRTLFDSSGAYLLSEERAKAEGSGAVWSAKRLGLGYTVALGAGTTFIYEEPSGAGIFICDECMHLLYADHHNVSSFGRSLVIAAYSKLETFHGQAADWSTWVQLV